jgi:hypothetical protein
VPAQPKPKPPSRWQIEAGGKTYRSIRDACRSLGIEIHTFRNRINRGCTIEQALGLEPLPKRPRKGSALYEIDGEQLNLNDIAKKYGIDPSTFKRRVEKGMNYLEAASKPSRRGKLKKARSTSGG